MSLFKTIISWNLLAYLCNEGIMNPTYTLQGKKLLFSILFAAPPCYTCNTKISEQTQKRTYNKDINTKVAKEQNHYCLLIFVNVILQRRGSYCTFHGSLPPINHGFLLFLLLTESFSVAFSSICKFFSAFLLFRHFKVGLEWPFNMLCILLITSECL